MLIKSATVPETKNGGATARAIHMSRSATPKREGCSKPVRHRDRSRVAKNATGWEIGRTALPDGPAYVAYPSRRQDYPNAETHRVAEHSQVLVRGLGFNNKALTFVLITPFLRPAALFLV
jgi:hypothetical protein